MRYKDVTVGGTFDRLHRGHRALIDQAFKLGKNVYLGITTDKFVANLKIKNQKAKLQCKMQNYLTREKAVKDYLKEKGWIDRVEIVPIADRFGTTLNDENLEAIVVSPETELVATEINLQRGQKNWPALEIVVVPWVLAEDGQPINSIRIRQGEIDREGRLFALPEDWGVRKLPEELRKKLKMPLGRLVQSSNISHQAIRNSPFPLFPKERVSSFWERGGKEVFLLITVGDVVTKTLLAEGVVPDVAVVDLYVGGKQVYRDLSELGFLQVKYHYIEKNPAGTLSFLVYQTLKKILQSRLNGVLQIKGEEDLVTLFAIFIAPLGSVVIYGQPARHRLSPKASAGGPDKGVVIVEVTEEKKKEVRNYIKQFIS